MATFVVLVSLSVIVMLAALHRYFGKQVESEFYEKLLAQKACREGYTAQYIRLTGFPKFMPNCGIWVQTISSV